MKGFPITLTLLLATALLPACTTHPPSKNESDTPEIGDPNPAAVFCVEQGGGYRLDSGKCQLPDGTTVDAGDYYRKHH